MRWEKWGEQLQQQQQQKEIEKREREREKQPHRDEKKNTTINMKLVSVSF